MQLQCPGLNQALGSKSDMALLRLTPMLTLRLVLKFHPT